MFLVPSRKASVKTIQYAEVSDKVSVANIDLPIVAIICDSVNSVLTLSVPGMLKIY